MLSLRSVLFVLSDLFYVFPGPQPIYRVKVKSPTLQNCLWHTPGRRWVHGSSTFNQIYSNFGWLPATPDVCHLCLLGSLQKVNEQATNHDYFILLHSVSHGDHTRHRGIAASHLLHGFSRLRIKQANSLSLCQHTGVISVILGDSIERHQNHATC